ncbi:MAG TPA: protein kinase [Bryobacteraceae bacterium]|nr:protein kinase [Bryobacteraceae bacterium]
MPNKAQDDDLVMSLVEMALAKPLEERQSYLQSACANDSELFSKVWDYVECEQRMNGFLLEPLYPPISIEHPFEPQELLEGRFRIVREVAQGGMGIVYEAEDEKLERRIALKCAKTGFRKRLPPEVRHASEISHPNVCKIFEIHTASTSRGEIDFLTMEFLDGETLAERVRRGAVPEPEAREIALQLCAGLAEAHRKRVIHGDLKSNNVILTPGNNGPGRAVITDFGLARRPETAQRTAPSGQQGGTPAYMAPELWKGEKASTATDIYALGVILFELISGRTPERPAPGEGEWLSWKPPAAHPKWDGVIRRCLDPDPARRFRDADEVALALAPPPRRRWVLGAAAAALLAVVSGLVTYEKAAAPRESVRLAVLPFASVPETAALAQRLSSDTSDQLARLRSSGRTKLTVIPLARAAREKVDKPEKARTVLDATHVLHGTLTKEKQKVILHAYVTATGSMVNATDWSAEYAAGELRYGPVALAGMVTGTFRLPALAALATVNAAAIQDYLAGLACLRRNSGADASLAFLERAVIADPDSPLTHAALAESEWVKYFLTKDQAWLTRTEESVRRAEVRNPDLAQVHRVAGLLLANSGNYELAEKKYGRAIELDPVNSDTYRRLGMAFDANNQLDQALAAYRRAIELDPRNHRNHQALGAFYNKQSNYLEAVKHFQKTVELAADEPDAHFALGTIYKSLGRFAEAESELRFALRAGDSPTALQNLALVLMYQKRDQEAIGLLSQGLSRWPERYQWWMNLGASYRRIGLESESGKATRRALELAEKEMAQNPRSGRIRSHLAYLCAKLGNRTRAESEIAQALLLSPNDTGALYAAAQTYESLGERDATLAVLGRAPGEVFTDLSRWPELADLHKDPRFIQLVASHKVR